MTLIVLCVCFNSFACSNGFYRNSIEDVRLESFGLSSFSSIERAKLDDLLNGIHKFKNQMQIKDSIYLNFTGYVYGLGASSLSKTTVGLKNNKIIIRGDAVYFPSNKEVIALLLFVKDNKKWVKRNLKEYKFYNQDEGITIKEMLLPRSIANFLTYSLRKFVTYKYAKPKLICQIDNFKMFSDLTHYYLKSGDSELVVPFPVFNTLSLNNSDLFLFGMQNDFLYIEKNLSVIKGWIPYYRSYYIIDNNDSMVSFRGNHCWSSDSLWYNKKEKKLYFKLGKSIGEELGSQIYKKPNLSLIEKIALMDSIKNGILTDGFFKLTAK